MKTGISGYLAGRGVMGLTKYAEDLNKSQAKSILYALAFLGLPLLGLVIYLAFFTPDDEYLLKELVIREAIIIQMDNSEKPWIRVSVPGLENQPDLWIEASQDFYNAHRLQDWVGVRLGKYDKFAAKKQDGKKYRRFEFQVWGVEEIYNSLADAQADNPVQRYSTPGKVVGKEVKDHRSYLILDLEGKRAKTVVEKSFYDRVQIGDTVRAQFESVGEFTRFLGVVNTI